MIIRILTGILLTVNSASAMAETLSSGFYLTAKVGVSQFRSSENALNSSGVTAGERSYDMASTHLKNTSRTVFTPGVAVGYRFVDARQQPVRVEFAFQHFGKSDKSFSLNPSVTGHWVGQAGASFPLPASADIRQSTRASTLMVNTYYDYTVGGNFTPYVMAGIGAAFVRNTVSNNSNVGGQTLSSGDFSHRATNLAWALGTGISWAVTRQVSVDVGYVFTNAGDISTTYSAKNGINEGRGDIHTKVQLHSLFTGVRYQF
ncbi:outer membrane protein [Serratia sp. S4]|uniref:outer membrane protein n=1 Tax=Serratia sp. S4 TaxID=768491 RepID=UPI00037A752C|nr:outer membrane beta-barrel protein [Serratia sp. S4]